MAVEVEWRGEGWWWEGVVEVGVEVGTGGVWRGIVKILN